MEKGIPTYQLIYFIAFGTLKVTYTTINKYVQSTSHQK